ncbi:MAG: acyltransferase [Elusimicrobia bacterium]|nr:acyltransferase [Elusimicrobiota bacterium]
MKIGFLQFKPIFGAVELNLKKIEKHTRNVHADLLVLPELSNSGYIFTSKNEVEKLSENIPEGPTTKKLIEIANKNKTFIVCGVAEKQKSNYYNSAVLVGPKGYIGKYRKLHLFNDEKLWFKPGEKEPEVFSIKGVKIGIMICFDWIFPETMRVLSLKGAQIICHCANLVLPYCQKAMITRCIENRVFAITANRTGSETRRNKRLLFTGKSQIVDPYGKLLVSGKINQETVKIVNINPKNALNKNILGKNNLFKDRRINLYKGLIFP